MTPNRRAWIDLRTKMEASSLASDAKKLLKSVLIAFAILSLPFYGNSIYLYLKKPVLLSEGKAIVQAVEKFREANRRFPNNLQDLGYSSFSRWRYYCSDEAGEFGLYRHVGWLGHSLQYYSVKRVQESKWWWETANGDRTPIPD